ncbi:MAG: hypothetical protein ABS939_02570 [Psychrobacillus sp.]
MTNLSRAKRQMLRGAIAIIGPSGAGKTLGGLLLAYGMMKKKYPDLEDFDLWGKIGLVDTEHKRSLIYEGMMHQNVTIGQFWHYELNAPFSVDRYAQAFTELKNVGAEVIVIDSTSHAWEGEGGVLDYQQQLGGRFQDWNTANKDAYAPMVSLFTGEKHDVHVINTVRAKQEYAMQRNEFTEKMEVAKLGTKPVQRDSLEYEFQVVFNVDMDNKFRTSKDNSGLFKGKYEELTPAHGAQLFDWLEAGVDIFAEKRAELERQEKQRVGLIEDIKKQVADFGLEAWFNETLKHAFFKGLALEQMPLEMIEYVRKGLQGKMIEVENQQKQTVEVE